MRKISIVLIIVAVICTFFVKFETTTNRKNNLEKDSISDYIEMSKVENNFDAINWVVSNLPDIYHENNDLSFLDGVKNGILVIASYARDVIVGTICDYLSGFQGHNIIFKAIWLFIGLVIEIIKNVVSGIFSTLSLTFKLFFQKGSFSYYIGYLAGLCVSLNVLNTTKEN